MREEIKLLNAALRATILAGICTPALFGQATTTVSHEKEWIAAHYYQLQFMVHLDPLVTAASHAGTGLAVDQREQTNRLNAAQIDVALSNFVVGPISDILNRRWMDMKSVPTPPREILEVSVGGHNDKDGDLPSQYWETATARWKPASPLPPSDIMAVYQTWTVARALEEMKRMNNSDTTFTRYATFQVTFGFQGKTNTYNALYLFGTNPKGEEEVKSEDGYLETNSSLTQSAANQTPIGLLHSHLAEYPPLNAWLKTQIVAGEACTSGRFCCVGTKCGISSTDLDKELSQPRGKGAYSFPPSR